MRVLVALLGVLLSLPWVVALLAFNGAYPTRRQRLGAALLGLPFGACMVTAAGSLLVPSWRTAAAWGLAALAVFYGAVAAHQALRGRRRSAAPRPRTD